MISGRYRDRITIQKVVQERTATGIKKSWQTDGVFWGRVVPANVDARERYQQLYNTEITHTIYFRGEKDINLGDCRFIWKGRILRPIAPVLERGRTASIAVREEGYGDS